ncbi:MAG: hypothetical protein K8S97_17075 [Anaerolineae bacterium]|nr:hypothetical protein [Anaerolineae bacterium]
MFRHSNRGTVVWLFIVGLALIMTLMAGSVSTAVGAGLLAAYMGLVVMLARDVELGAVFSQLPNLRTHPQQEPTAIAQEAASRARRYRNFDAAIRLLDVGLIVDEQRPDGMALRRGRFISLDDEGIRPFAIVDVPAGLAGRMGHVRFELRDATGQLQYVYEEEKWLQPGENVLLPDYRLPVRKKADELNDGGWSAHVLVDAGVLGVHHFNVSASLEARRRNIGSDGEILRERVWRNQEEDEALPLSLEELLRQQSRARQQNRVAE